MFFLLLPGKFSLHPLSTFLWKNIKMSQTTEKWVKKWKSVIFVAMSPSGNKSITSPKQSHLSKESEMLDCQRAQTSEDAGSNNKCKSNWTFSSFFLPKDSYSIYYVLAFLNPLLILLCLSQISSFLHNAAAPLVMLAKLMFFSSCWFWFSS